MRIEKAKVLGDEKVRLEEQVDRWRSPGPQNDDGNRS